jgi:hypothetical protein
MRVYLSIHVMYTKRNGIFCKSHRVKKNAVFLRVGYMCKDAIDRDPSIEIERLV